MFRNPPYVCRYLVIGFILLATLLTGFSAEADFEKIAKQSLAEIHAQSFQAGRIKECVALYATDAKFFVDNKLVATGETELLKFYQGLRDADQLRKIEVEKFLEIGGGENHGWAIFTYTKEFDLTGRDPQLIQRYKLEGYSVLKTTQYGTAIFSRIGGQWKIQVMTVFDPEIWEGKKEPPFHHPMPSKSGRVSW